MASPQPNPACTTWLFNNGSLWTEWDSGGAAGGPANFNGPQHFAPLGSSAVVGGVTYQGAVALMNGSGSGGRTIISDLEADAARLAYGYTITPPTRFGTMYGILDNDGTLRINTTSLTNSNDDIDIYVQGGNLAVDIDTGSPVAGIDPTGNISSEFPLASVQRISIDTGTGNDVVTIWPSNSIPDHRAGQRWKRPARNPRHGGADTFNVDWPTLSAPGINIPFFNNFSSMKLYSEGGGADLFLPDTGDVTNVTVTTGLGSDALRLHSLDTGTITNLDARSATTSSPSAPALSTPTRFDRR